MEFSVEKTISPFIQSQFPRFYEEEGPNFILFMKAYYEWMEENNVLTDNTLPPIYQARNLFNYRDIDNTLEDFLVHFQKKYLYGIPFNIIANKRFLLKHVLDIYRSKGSINSFKLLFKLLYDQEVDIYLPSNDMLKVSDGTWIEPKFLEVSDNGSLENFVGKTIIGLTSSSTAIVESYIKESASQGFVNSLYVSNILPKGGAFVGGEKIIVVGDNSPSAVTSAPIVVGSLNNLDILNGGQNFRVGDILKIPNQDVVTGNQISYGRDGLIKVTKVGTGQGSLTFNILNGGFGYKSDSDIFIYNANGDNTGNGATFNLSSFSYIQTITYNTDLLCDYLSVPLNATTYNLPANTSANLSSRIYTSLNFVSNNFGSIASLTNIFTGKNYLLPPYIFVRSTIVSNTLPGTVSFSTTSNTITGTGTSFTNYFNANDVIVLVSNSTFQEKQIIKSVANDTQIILYQPPKHSNTSGTFKAAPVILPANFVPSDPIMYSTDNTINGKNENIYAPPSSGSNIVQSIAVVDSGKGYVDGEFVSAYLYSGLNNLTIANGGIGYSNNDPITFAGGGTSSVATGYVTTNSVGGVTAAILTFSGSGYTSLPNIYVQTKKGSGAILTTTLTDFNTTSVVQGVIVKGGVGVQRGYWSTTRGFLDSDKYIQDSYFYQDYSYQLKVASTLDKYKNIIYNTFHPSGSELFGDYALLDIKATNTGILYEVTSPTYYQYPLIKSDTSLITSDVTYLITDNEITSDVVYTRADSTIKLDTTI